MLPASYEELPVSESNHYPVVRHSAQQGDTSTEDGLVPIVAMQNRWDAEKAKATPVFMNVPAPARREQVEVAYVRGGEVGADVGPRKRPSLQALALISEPYLNHI